MYCTKCGRKLEDGEVCTCTQKTQAPHMQAGPAQVKETQAEQPGQENAKQQEQTDTHATGGQETQKKNVFEDVHLNEKDVEWAKEKGTQAAGTVKEIGKKILRTLRKPVSHAVEMAENSTGNDGLKLIVTKAVVLAVFMLILSVPFLSVFGELMVEMIALLVVVIVVLGVDWLETAVLRVFNGAFRGKASKNAMYAVVGTRAVYELAGILIIGIFYEVIPTIASGIGAALILLGIFAEFAAYIRVVEMDDDRKAIVFFLAKICTLIIVSLIVTVLVKDMFDSLYW